jgi:hypothetical protein
MKTDEEMDLRKPVRLEVLNPTSRVAITAPNAPRLDTLNGKTVCELWVSGNWAGEATFPVLRDLLRRRFPAVRIVPYTEFPYTERGLSTRETYEPFFDKMGDLLRAKGCDAVLIGNGGCGCAIPVSTLSALVEKAGFPTVTVVSGEYVEVAGVAAQGQGLPGLAVAAFPSEVMWRQVRDVRPACEKAIEAIIHGLTTWKPPELPRTQTQARELVFEGVDYQDAVNRMEGFFLARMWSDGLPLIPPTQEGVAWMLTGTDLPRDKVITNKFSPRYGAITVENIAVNALMAGARPEYFPVILAAVDRLGTREGLELTHVFEEALSPLAPWFIVNGPIAGELNINSSFGVLGPGWKANAAIGRALSLVLINGGGGNSGPAGTRRAQSTAARYTCCFAENETENPWHPFHVDHGYAADASTVTIMAGKGTHFVHIVDGTEEILRATVRALQGFTYHDIGVPWDELLILCPDHAHRLARAGWNKESIQEYIHERARIPLAEAEKAGIFLRFSESLLGQLAATQDRQMPVPITEKPGDLNIVVAGGTGNGTSTLVAGMKRKVTAEIDPYKPGNWRQLLESARKDLLAEPGSASCTPMGID